MLVALGAVERNPMRRCPSEMRCSVHGRNVAVYQNERFFLFLHAFEGRNSGVVGRGHQDVLAVLHRVGAGEEDHAAHAAGPHVFDVVALHRHVVFGESQHDAEAGGTGDCLHAHND
jgi:hypothetical protein